MANSHQEVINVKEVRSQAAKSVECGAVTEDYPLDLELACKLLNEALASEILCVLRYRHHQIVAKGIDSPQVAAEFKEHAEDESEHMLMIAERIDQLGGDPDFNPDTISERSPTQFGKTSDNLFDMIAEDLVAERIAIDVYKKMVNWFGAGDPTTRRMLEGILKDEEDHANDLADLLAREPRKSLNS